MLIRARRSCGSSPSERTRALSPAHDAIGVWVTELPITPERVLRALDAEPRWEGKTVIFDEELSVNAVSGGGMRFEVPA